MSQKSLTSVNLKHGTCDLPITKSPRPPRLYIRYIVTLLPKSCYIPSIWEHPSKRRGECEKVAPPIWGCSVLEKSVLQEVESINVYWLVIRYSHVITYVRRLYRYIVTLLPSLAKYHRSGSKKGGRGMWKYRIPLYNEEFLGVSLREVRTQVEKCYGKTSRVLFPLVNDRTIGWFFYAPKCPSSCHRLSLLKPLRRSFFKAALITVFKGILQQKRFIFAHV